MGQSEWPEYPFVPDLLKRFRQQQSCISDRFRNVLIMQRFNRLQFVRVSSQYCTGQFTDSFNNFFRGFFIDPKEILKRMINHLDQTKNNGGLKNRRQTTNSRAVSFPLK